MEFLNYDKNSSIPRLVLQNLKLKNNHRLVNGNLNINSISGDNLKLIIQGNIDILVIKVAAADMRYFSRSKFSRSLVQNNKFSWI